MKENTNLECWGKTIDISLDYCVRKYDFQGTFFTLPYIGIIYSILNYFENRIHIFMFFVVKYNTLNCPNKGANFGKCLIGYYHKVRILSFFF